MNPNPETLRHRVELTRWLATGSLLGLILLGLTWELWLAGGASVAALVYDPLAPAADDFRLRPFGPVSPVHPGRVD